GQWEDSARSSGFFCYGLLEAHSNQFRLVVDKRSAEPIYYRQLGNLLYFAPEAKALARLQGVSNSLNMAAVGALLGHGHLLNHQSMFSGINRLGGGTELRIADGQCKLHVYWEYLPGIEARSESEAAQVAELGDLVEQSVIAATEGPEKTVVFLSGGYDSRAILGSALKGSDTPVSTVTWGMDETHPGTDGYVARELANRTGCEHVFLPRSVEHYGAWFEEANHLIDAQSDVAAHHPQEFQLMSQLKSMGYRKVVRGDEAFGWRWRAYNTTSAFGNVRVKPFKDVLRIGSFINREACNEIADANQAEFDRVWKRCSELPPNIAKDHLYFNHRLQTYLGSASYYKQVLHQQINPLLSDEILAFMRRVPESLRVEKALFSRVVQTRYAKFLDVPIASEDGLEDWGELVYTDTPVRRYMAEQISDEGSAIWSIFSRDKIVSAFERKNSESATEAGRNLRETLYDMARSGLEQYAPALHDHFRGKNSLVRGPSNVAVLSRFLVLKHLCDKYL
ncbi:MAG: asparagine synthase-related protein, partial [Pseudomonadota bacterium]